MFSKHNLKQAQFARKDIKEAFHCAVDNEDIEAIKKYTFQLTQVREHIWKLTRCPICKGNHELHTDNGMMPCPECRPQSFS